VRIHHTPQFINSRRFLARGVTQVVEHLLFVSSNPSTAKKKKIKRMFSSEGGETKIRIEWPW
jgi:hypothetical protein